MDKILVVNMKINGIDNIKKDSARNKLKLNITCTKKDYVEIEILKS